MSDLRWRREGSNEVGAAPSQLWREKGLGLVVELPGPPFLCQGMFEPYLKSFYIRSTDPTQIKILKVSDGWQVPSPMCPLR